MGKKEKRAPPRETRRKAWFRRACFQFGTIIRGAEGKTMQTTEAMSF